MSGPEAKRLSRRTLVRGFLGGGAGLAAYTFGVEPEWIELTRTEVPVRGLGKGL